MDDLLLKSVNALVVHFNIIVKMQPDNRTSLIVQILDICKEEAAKSEIMHKLSLSNSELRRISAELVDKGFLQFSEPGIFITTDKGYEFLGLKSKDDIGRQ
jgi:predicted transcriptional regulator